MTPSPGFRAVGAWPDAKAPRKPVRLWFQAMWWVATEKTGLSAKTFMRELGLPSHETPRRVLADNAGGAIRPESRAAPR